MSDAPFQVRPTDPAPASCKLCGGVARLFGVIDFNRNCEEIRGKFLPPAGIPIPYRRCAACGLVYTEAFDDWSHADFETHIYDAGYSEVDADYEEVRPTNMAAFVARLFAGARHSLDILDYGGGNGVLAARLKTAGFPLVETYDPFHPAHRTRPDRRFDLVTCFETLEHMPDPTRGAADIAALLKPDGLLLFSTLVQPADFDAQGMQWWYIGPRNGHVTLHSRASLTALWAGQGLQLASFNDNMHTAFRTLPPFAQHLMPSAAAS
ncbi:MAG: SAM-dependent methyltransferase [Phenylobacterium sp.]|jgi:SAM-dependent methyltransferase|uniref:class I SAM-dependent methyltransferase n=1 Tax=Phenylobacterium sp. TaxID=1871053 RepID=UPI002605889B|nr:class I SAM-dependent methyltransferase [Phenylobacterium sp.]MDB5498492.1 SAM-dependent methyltransferase [Phenylobacterium sp.]